MSDLSKKNSLFNVFRKVEATIGAFFAFFVGFVVAVLGGDIVCVAYPGKDFALLCTIWVVLVLIEALFLYALKTSLEQGSYPFAPRFALKLRRMPLVLRPFAAIWWIFHFLIGIAALILIEHLTSFRGLSWEVHLFRFLAFVMACFTVSYSANLYALLTLTAVGGSERMVARVWRWRVLLDFIVALAVAAVPLVTKV